MIQFGANFSTLGVPETGLSPTITIRDIASGAVVVSADAMTEIGDGAYAYEFTNDITKEYSALIDGGSDSLDSRYLGAWSERAKTEAKVESLPVNPVLDDDLRLDNLDAPISSRSNHADPTNSIKGADNRDLTQVYDNEKGTDGAYTGTPPTVEEIKTGLEADGTKLTGIKNQTDQINFLGTDIKATLDGEEVTTDSASRLASQAVGFSTHSPADVWTAANRELSNPDDYKADVSGMIIDIKRLLGLNQENYRLFNPVYDSDGYLLSVTTKIYQTAADCDNDTNAIAEYTMQATYLNKQLNTYKVIKV